MPAIETFVAGAAGFALGALIAAVILRSRAKAKRRRELELEARVRRSVVPVLERRAATLAIPPASRGSDDDGPIELAVSLARSIQLLEESGELPFGDTVEVARKELETSVSGSRKRA
jgi:hypothetical protein